MSGADHLRAAVDELLEGGSAGTTPVQATAYDTSWLAAVEQLDGASEALLRLTERQRPDGSWGAAVGHGHDRVLTTISVLLMVADRGPQERRRLEAGQGYLWRHVGALSKDPHHTVGFEMLLPTLVDTARRRGLDLPYGALDRYRVERERKLELLPADGLLSTPSTALFSLEAFADDMDTEAAADQLLPDGSMATSPSATAFLLGQFEDWRERLPTSAGYLRGLLSETADGLPAISPCDVFMRAWLLTNLHHGALLEYGDPSVQAHLDCLYRSLGPDGVGWSSTGLRDSDDTAVTLMVLSRAGYEVDGRCLLTYEREKHFAVFEYERNPSVSGNLHILEALETLPEEHRERVGQKLVNYLRKSRNPGGYWVDKWHASAYAATSSAVMSLPPYLPEETAESVRWMLATQHPTGGWGQYGPTDEETALTLLALLTYARTVEGLPREPLRRAAAYLMCRDRGYQQSSYPELWVSKTLYAPRLVIRSAIVSALGLYHDTFGELA